MTWTPGNTPGQGTPWYALWFLQVGWRGRPAPVSIPWGPSGMWGRRRAAQMLVHCSWTSSLWFNTPSPLHLFNEGLTQPFGYWGHSVSLGPLNTGGESLFPPELQMASFLPLWYLVCCHLWAGFAVFICKPAIWITAPQECPQTLHCDGLNASDVYVAWDTGSERDRGLSVGWGQHV